MSEQVYCVKASQLPEPSKEARVQEISTELLELIETKGSFRPRDSVETDPSWRQIIPYALIAHKEGVLLLKRLSAGNESRLHDRYTLGIGGHINPDVSERYPSARTIIEAGLIAELREELHIGGFQTELVGMIHESSTEVSAVHTGLVFIVTTHEAVRVRETHKLEGGFVGWHEVMLRFDQLEGWSQAVAQAFIEETEEVIDIPDDIG